MVDFPSFLRLLKSTISLFFHLFPYFPCAAKGRCPAMVKALGEMIRQQDGKNSGLKFETALGSNKLDVQARIELLWVKCCSIMFPTLQGEKMHINYDALMVDPTFWKCVFQHATAGQANMPSDISLWKSGEHQSSQHISCGSAWQHAVEILHLMESPSPCRWWLLDPANSLARYPDLPYQSVQEKISVFSA